MVEFYILHGVIDILTDIIVQNIFVETAKNDECMHRGDISIIWFLYYGTFRVFIVIDEITDFTQCLRSCEEPSDRP